MTTKKILAGVLAAASVLSVSATAFAAPAAPDKTKPVTAPGESEYEVSAVPMSATLDVVLPASMKAFLNPYGAEVPIDAASAVSKNGIVSWAYEIENKTTDFGIFVDVKNAKATVSKGITLATADELAAINDATTPTPLTDKKAGIALMASDDPADIANAAKIPGATAKAAYASGTVTQGAVVFTNTAQSVSKVAYVPAGTAAASTKTYLGITGAIGTVYATGDNAGEDVEWTEDDTVTTAFILKINPAAKAATDAAFGTTGGGAGITETVGSANIGFNSDAAFTLGTATANDTYPLTINSTSYTSAVLPTFSGYTITNATTSAAGVVAVATSGLNAFKLDVKGTGTATVTYSLTKDSDSSTCTVTFNITVS